MLRRAEPDPELMLLARARLAQLVGTDAAPRRALEPPADDEAAVAERDPAVAARHTESALDGLETPPVRGRFGSRQVAVICVMVLVGLLVTGWVVVRARPVALASPGATLATPAPGDPGAASTAPPSEPPGPASVIVVHVLGAVTRPGLVQLVSGARVQDAITAAGGLRASADPEQLNLAQVLTDGQQIVIGTARRPAGEVRDPLGSAANPGGGTGAGTGRRAGAPLDLNAASQAQLEELPGVGPVTAKSILAWREQHGRFSRVEELQEVDGIGPKTYAQLAPHVRV